MKKLVTIGIAALLVGACLAFLTADQEEVSSLISIEEFGQVMNDINACIARIVENPGILEVDQEFRKDFRESLMFAKGIVGEWKGNRIVKAASDQYRAYFDEILASLDIWSPEVASRLSVVSRDAAITLRTCLTRVNSTTS
jgi:hypothetical protein